MLPVDWHTIRLYLHVLAAAVWVGGQLTLAGLVPGLRALAPDAPRLVARRFNRIAWPAYAVLVVTGVWNITAAHATLHGRYGTTLIVKLVVVALSRRERVGAHRQQDTGRPRRVGRADRH